MIILHCPVCKKKIDSLRGCSEATEVYDVRLDGDKLDWNYRNTYGGWDHNPGLTCPKCAEILFTDEDEALKFLKFGDLYPWRKPKEA